jgi:hypothetical protein
MTLNFAPGYALSVMPSSAVANRYDHARERCQEFVTGRIRYIDNPVEVAASFRSAFSKGTFFNTYIRDRYDFREITRARAS